MYQQQRSSIRASYAAELRATDPSVNQQPPRMIAISHPKIYTYKVCDRGHPQSNQHRSRDPIEEGDEILNMCQSSADVVSGRTDAIGAGCRFLCRYPELGVEIARSYMTFSRRLLS